MEMIPRKVKQRAITKTKRGLFIKRFVKVCKKSGDRKSNKKKRPRANIKRTMSRCKADAKTLVFLIQNPSY